jgi:hypothetical protein
MRFILTYSGANRVSKTITSALAGSLKGTYATLLTASDGGLGLGGLGLGLGGLLGRGGLGGLWGLLGLLSGGSGLLGLLSGGGGLLGLLGGRLLLATLRSLSGLELDKILSDGDGVLLVDKKLLDSTGLGGVHGHVDLMRKERLLEFEFAENTVFQCDKGKKLTLSVSIVAISSSRSTKSPTSVYLLSIYVHVH